MNINQFTLAFSSLAAALTVPLPCAAHNDPDHGARVAIRAIVIRTIPPGPSGGWHRKQGDVNFAEFSFELWSPLSAVVGHQAWRMDPSYLEIEPGERVHLTNRGGRTHTFTEVQSFGGGKIPNPALNKGLLTAPECPASIDIPAGGKAELSGLAEKREED